MGFRRLRVAGRRRVFGGAVVQQGGYVEGAIEHADEALLVAKTTPDHREALQARIVELHPYELPEVIAVEAAALPAYLDWIVRETQPR